MDNAIRFELSFDGGASDEHRIDFYDVAQALIAFQRSLALTTHLVLNDEIITQAPALKNAEILAVPPEAGSWKFTAVVMFSLTGLYHLGTTPNNTPIGHLIFSLYDYMISESLGAHVDYNKSLGQLYEEAKKKKISVPEIKQSQADSLAEKCYTAIKEMHRPIYKSQTATTGSIFGNLSGRILPVTSKLDYYTYGYMSETFKSTMPEVFLGSISSYNSNTYKGRIFIVQIGRPVSFDLDPSAQNENMIRLITTSLSLNALRQYSDKNSMIACVAIRNSSRTGVLKSLTILSVSEVPKDQIQQRV